MRQRDLPRNYHFVLRRGLFISLIASLIGLLASCVAQRPVADRPNPTTLTVFAAVGSHFKQETSGVEIITIPAELNVIATYPIAVISNSAQPLVAQQFMDFLLSPAGQEILARYGFLR